ANRNYSRTHLRLRPTPYTEHLRSQYQALASFHRSLSPRNRHRRRLAVPVAAGGPRAILQIMYKPYQLFHSFVVRLPALFGGGQLRVAEHARFGITARPGNQRRRAVAEEIDVVERAVLLVEADDTALDEVLADVVAVQVQVQGRFQLAGVGTAAG